MKNIDDPAMRCGMIPAIINHFMSNEESNMGFIYIRIKFIVVSIAAAQFPANVPPSP